jgi:hypothetical protein
MQYTHYGGVVEQESANTFISANTFVLLFRANPNRVYLHVSNIGSGPVIVSGESGNSPSSPLYILPVGGDIEMYYPRHIGVITQSYYAIVQGTASAVGYTEAYVVSPDYTLIQH